MRKLFYGLLLFCFIQCEEPIHKTSYDYRYACNCQEKERVQHFVISSTKNGMTEGAINDLYKIAVKMNCRLVEVPLGRSWSDVDHSGYTPRDHCDVIEADIYP